jgi:DNA ligase (NAD+)
MTLTEAKNRHAQLVEEIRRHDRAYYVLAKPTITDAEYDRLYQELLDLEEDYGELATPDSPSQRVAGEPAAGFPRVKHIVPMLSLEKAEPARHPDEKEEPELEQRVRLLDQATLPKLRDFDRTIRELLAKDSVDYVMEPKIDGVSISVHYRRGKLELGATRGDGQYGDDITANIKAIKAIPMTLDMKEPPELLEVRGEAYMPLTAFEALNKKLQADGMETFPNARNATAGTLKQLSPRVVFDRPVRALFYGVGVCQGLQFSTHAEVLRSLREFGLPTQSVWWVCHGIEEALVRYNEDVVSGYALEHDLRTRVDYDIDGIVIKVNNLEDWKRLPPKARAPRYAIVHKPIPWITPSETLLKAITVQVGRTGVLTPVAELEPVFLQGSTIARATLHNQDEIKRKDIRIGDTVVVRKAGMVIPEVQAVVLSKRPAGTKPFDLFEFVGGKCPACGGPISKEEISSEKKAEVAWRCQNIAGCPAQKARRIEYFSQRKALDLESLGGVVAARLLDSGLVDGPVDLFNLKAEKLARLNLGTEEEPRCLGEKNASKVMAALGRARSLPLARWLYALGIPNVGEITAYHVAEVHRNLGDLAKSRLLKCLLEFEQRLQQVRSHRSRKTRAGLQTADAKSREWHAVLEQLEEAIWGAQLALAEEADLRAKASPQFGEVVKRAQAQFGETLLELRSRERELLTQIRTYERASGKPPKGLRPKLTELKERSYRLARAGLHESIGPVVAESIVSFFESTSGKQLLTTLRNLGIAPKGGLSERASEGTSSSLEGKTFVVTGTLASFSREEAAEEIRKRGGRVTNSVTKSTTFLVAGEAAGTTKTEDARRLGVETLTEEQFLAMLGLPAKPTHREQSELL